VVDILLAIMRGASGVALMVLFAWGTLALPKHPPIRFDEDIDEIDDAHITRLPSAPSHTPIHTTILMAMAMAMATQATSAVPELSTTPTVTTAAYESRCAASQPPSRSWFPGYVEL
jgi:hypothetical protein